MASNRAIAIGLVVVVTALSATEYAVAHHIIDLPDFIPDGAAEGSASSDAAEAPSAAANE